jgi:hypothetical protein
MYYSLSLNNLISRVQRFQTKEGQDLELSYFEEYCEHNSETYTHYPPGFAKLLYRNPITGDFEEKRVSIKSLLKEQLLHILSNPSSIDEVNRPDRGWFNQKAETLKNVLTLISNDQELRKLDVEDEIKRMKVIVEMVLEQILENLK